MRGLHCSSQRAILRYVPLLPATEVLLIIPLLLELLPADLLSPLLVVSFLHPDFIKLSADIFYRFSAFLSLGVPLASLT
jgi:hypothetical protein